MIAISFPLMCSARWPLHRIAPSRGLSVCITLQLLAFLLPSHLKAVHLNNEYDCFFLVQMVKRKHKTQVITPMTW